MAGAADLVAALTGGQAIEQDAYSKAAQRILAVQNAQLDMDKKVQDAYAKSRQNSNLEAFGNMFATLGPELQGQNFQLTPEQMSTLYRYGTTGGVSDIENVIKGYQQQAMRNRLLEGSLDEGMTDPNAVARAFFTANPMVPQAEMLGDAVVNNLYGRPTVNQELTDAVTKAAGESDKSGAKARDLREIQSLVDQGWTLADAQNEVYGVDQVDWNPASGRVERITRGPGGTATFSVVPPNVPPIAMPPPPAGESMAEQLPYATGIASAALSLVANPQSWLDIPLSERQKITIKARQHYRTAQNMLVASFVQNPKVPVAEREWINREIDLLPEWFKDPAVAAQTMMSLFDSLTRRLDYYDQILNYPGTPRDTYEQYFEAKLNVQQFLAEMGNPYQAGKPSAKAHPALQGQ